MNKIFFLILLCFCTSSIADDKQNMIRVAVLEEGWPPYQFIQGEKPTGFTVTLLSHLMNSLNMMAQWEFFSDWDSAHKALCNGEVDIILDAFSDVKSRDCFSLSKSYHRSPFVVVVNSHSFYFHDIKQINHSRIAVEQNFLLDDQFEFYYPQAKKEIYTNTQQALQAIRDGSADVYIGNRAVSKALTANDNELIIVAQAPLLLDSVHFAVSNKNTELLHQINNALSRMPEAELIQLKQAWFGTPQTFMGNSSLFLHPQERHWLSELPKLSLSWLSNWSPILFMDNNGDAEGLAMEFIKVFKQELGISFNFEMTSQRDVETSLYNDAIDSVILPKRLIPPLSDWVLSKPIINFPIVIVSNQGRKIDDIYSLSNKSVLSSDRKLLSELKNSVPSVRVKFVKDTTIGLKQLSSGSGDVYIGNLAVIAQYLRLHPDLNLIITGQTPFSDELVLAVNKHYAPLIPLLNRAIDSISQDEYDKIRNRWLTISYPLEFDWFNVLKKLTPFLFIILVVSFIGSTAYWRLRRLLIEKESAEMALAAAKDQAEKNSHEKAEFLATMSHEIRTPMNGIIGMLEQLSMSNMDFEQQQMLDVVSSSASGLHSIVSEVLDFSKIEAGKLNLESTPFLLREMIDKVLHVSSFEAQKKSLLLGLSIEPQLAAVYIGDELRLRQALINLVNNAVKFTEKGNITITLQVLSELNDKQILKVGVQDTGIGMNADEIARIFQPFEQAERSTSRRFGGTGLGLSICQQLVELMEGEMLVESKKEQGSWIGFKIPLRISAHTHIDPLLKDYSASVNISDPTLNATLSTHLLALGIELSQTNAEIVFSDHAKEGDVQLCPLPGILGVRRESWGWLLNSQPITNRSVQLVCYEVLGIKQEQPKMINSYSSLPVRVLVVDDNEINRMLIAQQLKQIGLIFDVVSNGQDALTYLNRNDYTLMLCDCHMPYMDGYELVKQIRALEKTYSDIPIIAMTADMLNDQKQRCLNAGMNDLLAKPIRLNDVSSVFEDWGIISRDGLKIDDLINTFGNRSALLSFLKASVSSLCDGLAMPLTGNERADWVHQQSGTIAILGFNELAEYGWCTEVQLRSSVAERDFWDFRAKLYIAMRQLECAMNMLIQELPDIDTD